MGRTIAITNQKGGVGKTTTAINLAASLAAMEQRVLLCDLDPQGNASMGSGINKLEVSATMNEVLLGELLAEQAITPTQGGYGVIPANSDLTVAEISLLQMDDREHQLKKALSAVKESYDYILLDCPPSLNMLTINGLVASDAVLIPMQCEYYALEGLTALLDTINDIKTVNPELAIDGLLRTLFDGRNSLAGQVSDQLLTHFNDKVYNTIIPRNIRLAEAPSHGLPGLMYDRYSAGAAAYLALAREILQRHGVPDLVSGSDPKRENNPLQLLKKRSESA